MADWRSFVAVAAGGALGAVARFSIALFVAERLGLSGFPYATLLINVSGSLLIGAVAGITAGGGFAANAPLRNFLAAGVLGGYTTFSTFSLETLELSRSSPLLGVSYALMSVLAGVLAAYAGFAAVRG